MTDTAEEEARKQSVIDPCLFVRVTDQEHAANSTIVCRFCSAISGPAINTMHHRIRLELPKPRERCESLSDWWRARATRTLNSTLSPESLSTPITLPRQPEPDQQLDRLLTFRRLSHAPRRCSRALQRLVAVAFNSRDSGSSRTHPQSIYPSLASSRRPNIFGHLLDNGRPCRPCRLRTRFR